MPTPPQLLHIPFDGGLDEYNDYIHIEPPNLIEAKNIIFPHDGAIEKRPGFINYIAAQDVAGSGSAPMGGMRKLAKHKNSVLVNDGVDLFSGMDSYNVTPSWARAGRISPVVATWTQIATGYQNVLGMDCIYVNNHNSTQANAGYIVIAYLAQRYTQTAKVQVYYSLIDAISGAVLLSGKHVNNLTNTDFYGVRLATDGNRVVIAYTDNNHKIYANHFSVLDPTNLAGEVLVVNEASIGKGVFDIVGDPDNGGTFRLVFETIAPIGDLRVFLYDTNFNFIISRRISVQNRAGVRGIGICVHNSSDFGKCLMVAKSNADIPFTGRTDVFLISVDYVNPLTVNGSSKVLSLIDLETDVPVNPQYTHLVAVAPSSSNRVCVTASAMQTVKLATTLSDNFTYYVYGTSDGFQLSAPRNHIDLGAMSRPFSANSRTYHHCDTPTDKSGLLMDLNFQQIPRGIFTPDIATPVAHTLPRITEDWFYTQKIDNMFLSPVHVVQIGTSNKYVTLAAQLITNYDVPKINLVTYDFDHDGCMTFAELGESTYFAGGLVTYYDGVHSGEVGFLQTPFSQRNKRTARVTLGPIPLSGIDVIGDYYYTVCFDHRDSSGQLSQSLFSQLDDKYKVNVPAVPASVIAECRPIYASIKAYYHNNENGYGPIYARFYRIQNGGVINSVYYNIYPDIYVLNNVLALADTFQPQITDVQPNTELRLHNYRYVTGDVLSNVAPPSCTHIVNHKERLWIIAGDQKTIWFSKKLTPGEQAAFCDEFTFSLTDNGQPLIALGSLDNNLVLFKEKAIYVVNGDGPPDTGYGGDISEPQKINGEIGCINPRSLLRIPQGLAFFSNFGLMMLTRSLDVDYFGKYVQNTVEKYPVVLGACVDNERNLAIWSLAVSPLSSEGILLVYDFVENKFCTWEVDVSRGFPNKSRDILFLRSKMFAISDRNNSVITQSTNVYKDLSAYVELYVRMAWIKPAGLQGFGRVPAVTIIGQSQSPDHNLNLEVFYDYELQPAYTHQFPVNQINALTIEQVSHSPQRNECQAISIAIKDSVGLPGSNGKGIRLEGITFTTMQEQGPVRMPVLAQS